MEEQSALALETLQRVLLKTSSLKVSTFATSSIERRLNPILRRNDAETFPTT